MKLCRECMLHNYSNIKTVHCYDCGVCIENYDHHCPWVGKCIGKGNRNYFNMFIISSIIMIIAFILGGLSSMN